MEDDVGILIDQPQLDYSARDDHTHSMHILRRFLCLAAILVVTNTAPVFDVSTDIPEGIDYDASLAVLVGCVGAVIIFARMLEGILG